MDESTLRMFITLGGIIASIAAAWGVAQQMIKSLSMRIGKLETSSAAVWKKSDEIQSRTSVIESKVAIHSSLLNPEKLADDAEWKGRMDERVKFIEGERKAP